MAAIDFPNAPTTGQAFGSWTYDGTKWVLSGSLPGNGIVAYAQITVNQSGITTSVNLTGLSVTWTADPSRTYKVTLYGECQSSVAGDVPVIQVMSGSTVKGRAAEQVASISGVASREMVVVIEKGLSGAQTRHANIVRALGSGSLTWICGPDYPSFIMVEDITKSGSTVTTVAGSGGGGSGFTYVQETAPTPVKAGDTWFDLSTAASGGTSWVAVSAEPGAAGPLNWVQFAPGSGGAVVGEWEVFTPVWTNLTLGNGTQNFRRRYVGKVMEILGVIDWGTTTAVPGIPSLTLPDSKVVASFLPTSLFPVGELHMNQPSIITTNGPCRANGGGTTVTLSYWSVSGTTIVLGNLAPTAPVTWASTAQWRVNCRVPIN